ncbi:MAG: hypothetical protein WCR46_14720 [Deltaproteobacteria bacterium]
MVNCIQIRKLGWLVLFFVLMSSTAFAVDGRWTVSNMHPVDGLFSKIFGIEGGQKVGVVGIPSDSEASKDAPALWKGDTREWVNLQKIGLRLLTLFLPDSRWGMSHNLHGYGMEAPQMAYLCSSLRRVSLRMVSM